MALKLRFDPQAKRDLIEIRDYLLAYANEQAANRVRAELRARFNRLRKNPNIGTTTTDAHIRILPPLRHPYRIYYTTTVDAVFILHVRHTARREPELDDLR